MSKLESQIESLLFISNQPFSVRQLMNATKADKKDVEQALEALIKRYDEAVAGISLLRVEDKYQLATAAGNAQLVQDYIKEEFTGELTRAALETLTIVAYRGPIVRAELEQIRGVNCAVILRNLQIRGLVDAHDDKKKMQTSYTISLDFLRYLGIAATSDLPDYERLNTATSIEKVLHPEMRTPTEEKSV